MAEIDQRAWGILTEDEQLALSLKHGQDKSSWEAGEILNRAHYKYLEVEARARHFLKMFTEHFLLYDEVIPDWVEMDERLKKFFHILIKRRRTVNEAVDLISDDYFSVKSFRDRMIVEELQKLLTSGDVVLRNVGQIILDFDRWNNFRVLPWEIQEPSAFKRRNKNADIRNIKNILNLHTYVVEKIIQKFTSTLEGVKVMYVPIYSIYVEPQDSIMRVKYNEEAIASLSKIGLYCFPKLADAEEFYSLIKEYDFTRKGKSCKLGQKFWPKFRKTTKNSYNYNAIQKRIPSRKYLETALRDLDASLLKPKEADNYMPKLKKVRVRKKE